MRQTIYLGADHAGFESKKLIKEFLMKKKYNVIDCGNTKFDKNDDYPDFAYIVAKNVANTKHAVGILFCGSAEGMSIAANKVRKTRAVVVHTIIEAKLTKIHNNANILCISGWHTSVSLAKKIIITWLKTPFSNIKRHKRRIQKIIHIENNELMSRATR